MNLPSMNHQSGRTSQPLVPPCPETCQSALCPGSSRVTPGRTDECRRVSAGPLRDTSPVGTARCPSPRSRQTDHEETRVSTDAIVLLKQDHKEIEKAFKAFEKAGDAAHKEKARLVDKIIELLTVHTYIENEVVYPRVRELVPEVEDDILESFEEHHVADVLVMELAAMKADDERFTAKTTVLIENVRHHIEEEEEEWFPKVREALGRKTLQDIGAEMQAARKKAPRKPSQPSALKKTVDAVIK